MEKRDFKKELKHLYCASAKEPVEVEVPTLRFLMIDGEGLNVIPRALQVLPGALEVMA